MSIKEERAARKAAQLQRAQRVCPVGRKAIARTSSGEYEGTITGYSFNWVSAVLVILDGSGPDGNKGGWCAYVGEVELI